MDKESGKQKQKRLLALFRRICRLPKESCFIGEFALLRERQTLENESADADVLSNAREAKTNNAKANILTNFGSGDLSPRLAGILMRRPGVRRTFLALSFFSVGLIEDAPERTRGDRRSSSAFTIFFVPPFSEERRKDY